MRMILIASDVGVDRMDSPDLGRSVPATCPYSLRVTETDVSPVQSSVSRLTKPGEASDPERRLSANRLSAGECGLICHIDGDHEDIERLKTMGVCLGRRLHVVKSGDPMIVSVMGTRLGIAARLSRHVFLRPDDDYRCYEQHRTP